MNTKSPDIIVTRYFAKGGYATRFWAIYLNGELLAVTVYRKGAIAIAQKLAETFCLENCTNDG